MSDAHDQPGGADDDFAKPDSATSKDDTQSKSGGDDPGNDNDVMTDDDLPSGGWILNGSGESALRSPAGRSAIGRGLAWFSVDVRWDHGEPDLPLSDGVITLRLPVVEDTTAIIGYATRPGDLDGGWLPLRPPVSDTTVRWVVEDWLAGWAGRRSHNGPALVVSPAATPEMVGTIGFGPGDPGVVEMIYGVAPRWRGRGVARRAARLSADWLVGLPGVDQVELRIGQQHLESQRAAGGAGFVLVDKVREVVEATGQAYTDLRFVYLPRA